VENVHFFSDMDPHLLGYRALAVSLSDLAASAAIPTWYTLALSSNQIDRCWAQSLNAGMQELADQFNMQLIGGDTTKSRDTVLTLSVFGFQQKNNFVTRSNAQPGDLIYITGTLGDAALAIKNRKNEVTLNEASIKHVQKKFDRPSPRVNEALSIAAIANSMIDISDGLMADLGHILESSQCGASIEYSEIPISQVMQQYIIDTNDFKLPLTYGDDYELCFTVPKNNKKLLEEVSVQWGCGCHCIGEIERQAGLRCYAENGDLINFSRQGYQHF
ncbi:MAG: thiamine-phosphate kinase, partial [Methylococcales bacterium]|nr:thiamine-phosphate kinase [Methylococcales bacterium]